MGFFDEIEILDFDLEVTDFSAELCKLIFDENSIGLLG